MSNVNYNGVDFSEVLTQSFDQEPIYDESGVNYLYTKFTIGIRAVFSQSLPPAGAAENPVDIMARVRKLLMAPRKKLIYSNAGATYINSPPTGSEADAKNGPFVRQCKITQFTNDTWLVEWAVETHLVDCLGSETKNPVISNRYKVQIEFDQNFYTKRTITGRIHFRTDFNTNPDDLRGSFFPPLLKGFQRTGVNITLTEDQTAFEYTFTDLEKYVCAPPPATKFEGFHRISTTTGGSYYTEQVVIRLWGTKESPKASLYSMAAKLALGRLYSKGVVQAQGKEGKNPKFIMAGGIQDYLHENYIELVLEAVNVAKKYTIYGSLEIPERQKDLDFVIFDGKVTDFSQQPSDPGERATAGLRIARFIYQDSCTPASILSDIKGDAKDPKKRIGSEGDGSDPVLIKVTPSLPQVLTSFNTKEFEDGAVTDYYVQIDYRTDQHTAMLPVGSSETKEASFVNLANPTLRKIVRWTAEKIGGQPSMPDPSTFDSNNVLLKKKITAVAPKFMPDGNTTIWRMAGTYIYGVKEPSKEKLFAGKLPFNDLPSEEVLLKEAKFVGGITQPELHLSGFLTR